MTDTTIPAKRRITRRIPWFAPVPVQLRANGWTPARQVAFIGHLAQTRSVALAAQRVGMARETAYRLRTRKLAEGFVRAWDAAAGRVWLSPNPKVTLEALLWQVETGLWRPVMRNRRFVRIARKANDTAMLRLLAHYDRAERMIERYDARMDADGGAQNRGNPVHRATYGAGDETGQLGNASALRYRPITV